MVRKLVVFMCAVMLAAPVISWASESENASEVAAQTVDQAQTNKDIAKDKAAKKVRKAKHKAAQEAKKQKRKAEHKIKMEKKKAEREAKKAEKSDDQSK